MRNDEITFEIVEHLGVLSDTGEWAKEVNLVAWNGQPPKIDIRSWDADHERMTRGVTLTESEAVTLAEALVHYYGNNYDMP